MGKGPTPPDPYKTANAQAGANFTTAQQNAIMGNVNEYTPYGSKTYSQSGWDPVYDASGKLTYAPRYSSEIQLSPDQQKLLAQQTGLQYNIGNIGLQQSARLQDTYGKEMDWSGLQDWKAAEGPGEIRQDQGATDRGAIEKAMMERYQRTADPRNAAQDVQLAARGLSPGSQGYGTVQQQRGDEAANASREAFLASGDESRRAQDAYNAATQQKYQLGADWAAQLNNLRQGQATEAFARRNQPLNEISAMMGMSGPTTPQFQPFQGSQMSAPNIGQMVYDNYNARSQQSSNALSGMFGVGAQIAGALPWTAWLGSDRRLKQDIVPLGMKLAGVPVYAFRYINDLETPQIGVMADEVRPVHPDAVTEIGGYDHVNYGLLRWRHDHG